MYNHLSVCQKIELSFKNVIYKLCIYKSYIYKEDLVLDNLQGLIWHKIQPKQMLKMRIIQVKSAATTIFKWGTTGGVLSCHTKVKEPSLPYYYPYL